MMSPLVRSASLVVLLLSTACAGKILFQSDFDPTPINEPPAVQQKVGSASVHGPAGSVIVIAPPVTPSGKWVQIGREAASSEVAGMQGNFSEMAGEGEYTFTTTVFMPTGSGAATIQFESFGQPVNNLQSFLHIDLLPDNQVRIDDDESSKFGSFPRDAPFIVQVTLKIGPSASTAQVVLSGAGASGTADRTIASPFQNMARQFGAVRLWMGFPHTGKFDATNIVVRSKEN